MASKRASNGGSRLKTGNENSNLKDPEGAGEIRAERKAREWQTRRRKAQISQVNSPETLAFGFKNFQPFQTFPSARKSPRTRLSDLAAACLHLAVNHLRFESAKSHHFSSCNAR